MTDSFIGIFDPSSSGGYTSQTRPDTFSTTQRDADTLTSGAPSKVDRTKSSLSSPQKVYVLTYDATLWAHKDTTDSITLLNGKPILVTWIEDRLTTQHLTLTHKGSPRVSWSQDSLKKIQPCGTLGVYLSEAKAKRVGKKWLYDQLLRLGVELPIEMQDGSQWKEPVWMKSGWGRTADGSWGYTISDCSPRNRLLVVIVSERTVDDSDSEEEHEDSDDNTEKPQYKLVGPPGSRKRVRVKPEKGQESGGHVGQGTDGGDSSAEEDSDQEDETESQDTDGGDDIAGEREDESSEGEDGMQDVQPRGDYGPIGW